MGTPMSPNYSNLFMDNFKQNLLHDYSQKKGLSPLVWFRLIDDNKEWLDHFIFFTKNYSKAKNMKSKSNSKFISPLTKLTFLMWVSLKHGKLRTTLSTRPTNSHFHLNTSSCHLSHVLLCKKFTERDFHEKELQKTMKQAAKLDRTNCYEIEPEKTKTHKRYFDSTQHPHLSAMPSTLKNNFHLISNDSKLSKLFKQNCHLPKKQITFWIPFEKRYCKLTTSFQHSTLWKMQTLPANKCSQTHH